MLQTIWELTVTVFAYGVFIPAIEHPIETELAITALCGVVMIANAIAVRWL